MPGKKYHNARTNRRADMVKVTIEEVNLDAKPYPVAQGRDRAESWGLFDIDLTHGVGSRFPNPEVGEVWWISKRIGSRWVLDHKVDPDREGGDDNDADRPGAPGNVFMGFTVREKKTHLTYRGFVTFDAVTIDENGDPQNTEYYIVEWVACTKAGNIKSQEKVKQHDWSPKDDEIDDEDDPASDYYVELPGNIERPKKDHYKARVRAVSENGKKGPWSDWTDPKLPFRNAMPEPPYPGKIDLRFRWKDVGHEPVFSAVTRFNDVNFWDIPGYDYEDDIESYIGQLQPLQRAVEWEEDKKYAKGRAVVHNDICYIAKERHTSDVITEPPHNATWLEADPLLTPADIGAQDPTSPFDGLFYGGDGEHYFIAADPQADGDPWETRRKHVKDKDAKTKKDREDPHDTNKHKKETDDGENWVNLGTIVTADIDVDDLEVDVDETGVVGAPIAVQLAEDEAGDSMFVVLTTTPAESPEQWLVYDRTNVSGDIWHYKMWRQFRDTGSDEGQAHSVGETLEWLKDPYHYKLDWHRVERPHTIWWRTRVRSKDRFNRRGPWSPWTQPELPWESIDWEVPPPEHLKADIEIRDYKTHPEYKLVARFKDPAPDGWDVPGGDPHDDLHHYIIQAEAVLPDPDGYIGVDPPKWYDGVSYDQGEMVRHEDLNFISTKNANLNHEPPNATYWTSTGEQQKFIIPDRRIGVLQADAQSADPTMTITLDDDVPDSMMKVIDDPDKQTFYMRIQTGGSEIDEHASEIVAAEGSTAAGDDRILTVERAQYGSAAMGHNAGDPVYMLTEHLRRRTVPDKDKDDPGKFKRWYTVDMGRIAHAKKFWWRVRGRSVDNFGHKGVWTDWTDPILPGNDPDLVVPYPDEIFLSFDKVHRHRHNKYRAIVRYKEVHYETPDGDREEDVTRYGVQLATSDGDVVVNTITDADLTVRVEEKRHGAPDDLPFFVLIEDEIVQVTARTLVSDRTYDYTIVRAQRATEAAEHLAAEKVFSMPFVHRTQSAKSDDDHGNYNRTVFEKVHKWYYYKARVRVFDRYNRHSIWSPWTDPGTPSDTEPPPEPENVLIDVDTHKITVTWDAPLDPNDPDVDPNGSLLDVDISFFQIQLSDDAGYSNILKFDRQHKATSKSWRIKKPKPDNKPPFDTYYVRVRSADASGNKSAWVEDSGAMNGVPTPDAPTITYDANEQTKKIRAQVLLATGVLGIDDDIDGYEFQLQPSENKRLAEVASAGEGALDLNNTTDLPNTPFTAYIQKEQLSVTNVAGGTATVSRGQNSTSDVRHRDRAKFQYFRAATKKRRRKTGEESEVGDPILAIFNGIHKGRWYRARVRAHDTKGLWGNWSDWGS